MMRANPHKREKKRKEKKKKKAAGSAVHLPSLCGHAADAVGHAAAQEGSVSVKNPDCAPYALF
jgi:hypothetical protein